jgi:acyl dehydratase
MAELKNERNGITDEDLAKCRSRIGTKFHVQERRNELACKETIVNFCYGVGDTNPLYTDEQYAKKTIYGCLVAPPSWLYSTAPMIEQPRLGQFEEQLIESDFRGFHSGDDWEFLKPVLIGDRISSEQIVRDVEEKISSFFGRMIFEYHDKLHYNQRGELVAKAKALVVRIRTLGAKEEKKSTSIQLPYPWTNEELKKIETEIAAEEIRGDKIRYWEDVQIGEVLAQIVKGPLGITDQIAFFAGCGSYSLRAHKVALNEYLQEPASFFRDPNTYSLEPTFVGVRIHLYAAQAVGQPYPFAWARQIISWDINLLTNWIGDEGWIKRCKTDVRHFVYLSDVVWISGKVVNKYVDQNGEYCVDIEITAINQRGQNVAPSKATVILPSRETRTMPISIRLPE